MKESEVVWALAHIGPATAKEVENFLGGEDEANSRHTFTRTFRQGLIIRRKRNRPDKMGPDPYEYALAPAAEEE